MKKCKKICIDKNPLSIYQEFHRKELHEFLMNLYKWNNMPKTIDLRFFNDTLLSTGFVGCFKNEKGIYCSDTAITGLDEYYRPTEMEVANIILKGKYKIGKDAAVCYNTSDYSSPESSLMLESIFAYRLAQLDLSIDISCINSRASIIASVNDVNEGLRTEEALKKLFKGDPAVISYKTAFDKGADIFPLKAKDMLVVSELADARRNLMADFYSYLGIDTIAVDKKERTNLVEMDSNKQQLHINASRMLEARKRFCEEFNEVFKTNISVELNIPKEVEYAESRTKTTANKADEA